MVMRNKLLIIAIVICSFFIVDKVSAESKPVTHTLTDKAREFFSNTDNFPTDVLPNVVLYSNGADSYSTNDNYFILTSFDSSIYSIKYETYTSNSRQKFLVLMLHDIENNIYNETSSYNGFNGYSNYVKNYKLYYDDETDEYSWGSAGSGGMWIKGYDNRNIYYSNFDIMYYEKDEVFFFKNLEYSNLPSYKFDDTIHDDNIAQTYFNLNLDQLKKNGYNLSLKYAYGNYTRDIIAPYLKITYNDNTNAYISLETNESPLLFVYMGEYEICLDNGDNITNVQVVFPMENTQDVDYKIQLESNVKFEISYIYDEVFSSNLTTIDLTGKYALIVIPKVNYQNELLHDFYINNNLQVRTISDVDNINNSIVATANCYNNVFRLLTDFRYKVGALQFVNDEYSTMPNKQKSVTFDTRYFNYYIANTNSDIIKITNPNTDKTTDLDMFDINFKWQLNESQADTNSIFGVFKIVNNYIASLKDMFNLFIEQFKFLFDGLNSQIRNFLISLFIVIVVCSIILIIRK